MVQDCSKLKCYLSTWLHAFQKILKDLSFCLSTKCPFHRFPQSWKGGWEEVLVLHFAKNGPKRLPSWQRAPLMESNWEFNRNWNRNLFYLQTKKGGLSISPSVHSSCFPKWDGFLLSRTFLTPWSSSQRGAEPKSPLLLCGHHGKKERKGELALEAALSLGPMTVGWGPPPLLAATEREGKERKTQRSN